MKKWLSRRWQHLALKRLITEENPIAYDYLGFEHAEPVSLTSTTFDSREELLGKYFDSKDILPKFKTTNIEHNINAWELSRHFPEFVFFLITASCLFDCVVWNHPHLGTEDYRLHRFLLAHFFASVKKVLKVSE